MRLTLRQVTTLGREVAAEFPQLVEVDGVADSAGGSDVVELLLRVRACGVGARTVMVDARRTSAGEFAADLRRRIARLMSSAPN
jgi:hypothetical protein